jgi:hypothetical protein
MNKPDIIKRIKQWWQVKSRWPKRCDGCGEVPLTLYRNPRFGPRCGHCLELFAFSPSTVFKEYCTFMAEGMGIGMTQGAERTSKGTK